MVLPSCISFFARQAKNEIQKKEKYRYWQNLRGRLHQSAIIRRVAGFEQAEPCLQRFV
jgi:hypothetical protein